MADGIFASKVSATRDANLVTNPIFVELTDGTNAIGVTAGALDVNIASGAVIVQYNEDTAHVTGDTGNLSLVVRNDVLATLVSADGDYSALQVDADGALYITISDATLAVTQSGTWTVDLGPTDNAVLDAIAASLVDVELNTDYGLVIGGGVEATALRVTIANDSTGLLTVDANQLDVDDLNLTDDAVKISGNANANTELNPIFTYNVNAVVSGEEIHDYDTAAAVASDTGSNHDYAVVGTFLLKSVIVSASGDCKFEIQTGPTVSLATVAVGFLTGKEGDTKQITFDPAIEVPNTGTGLVRVIRTNREGAANDVYSTIIGSDI